jgi:hypothetical protein
VRCGFDDLDTPASSNLEYDLECPEEVGTHVKVWGSSKQAAHYRPAETVDDECDRCRFMFPPAAFGGCRYVRGVIRGTATCDLFSPRKGGASTSPPESTP